MGDRDFGGDPTTKVYAMTNPHLSELLILYLKENGYKVESGSPKTNLSVWEKALYDQAGIWHEPYKVSYGRRCIGYFLVLKSTWLASVRCEKHLYDAHDPNSFPSFLALLEERKTYYLHRSFFFLSVSAIVFLMSVLIVAATLLLRYAL